MRVFIGNTWYNAAFLPYTPCFNVSPRDRGLFFFPCEQGLRSLANLRDSRLIAVWFVLDFFLYGRQSAVSNRLPHHSRWFGFRVFGLRFAAWMRSAMRLSAPVSGHFENGHKVKYFVLWHWPTGQTAHGEKQGG